MYKFRVILDTKEDVIREVALLRDFTLEDLHQTIVNAFEFDGLQMASFYKTDSDWNQGDEIPLFNMNEQVGGLSQMKDYKLDFIFTKIDNQLIYVYDFMKLWTFFVEFIGVFDEVEDKTVPLLLFALGDVPKEAPKKEFEIPIEEDDEDDYDPYNDDSFYY
ncbi:MAG: hypothetical protein V3U80_01665 [Flavobacteriaceae bacterium]